MAESFDNLRELVRVLRDEFPQFVYAPDFDTGTTARESWYLDVYNERALGDYVLTSHVVAVSYAPGSYGIAYGESEYEGVPDETFTDLEGCLTRLRELLQLYHRPTTDRADKKGSHRA
jgi:hypothetical protein